jgi:hypothetical protein
MKNRWFFAGMLALALVFGLIITGCPTDSDDGGGNMSTKFEGTWLVQKADDHIITFTFEGEFLRIVNTKSGSVTSDAKRHFTYTDTEIELSDGTKIPYVLEGNTLTSGTDVFVKQ